MIVLNAHFCQSAPQVDIEVTSEAGHPGLRWQHACRFLNYAARPRVKVSARSSPRRAGVVCEGALPNRTDAIFTHIVC